jgi:hypothetical protein
MGKPDLRRPEHVPPASSFYAIYQRPFSTLRRSGGGARVLRVNGKEVRPGLQSADTLMMLGILDEEIDDLWRNFVVDHWPTVTWGSGWGNAPEDDFAVTHQDGAGWKIEAWVEGKEKLDVRDLAYVDFSQVRRRITMTMRQWNHLTVTDQQIGKPGFRFDDSVGRTSTLISETVVPEPGAAVGSWYSGVSQPEIDAAVKAANALEAARRDLRRARDEMEVAIRVADAAWKGDRAEAVKYKLCLEGMAVEAIQEATHRCEDFTQYVVRLQRAAKSHDDDLKRWVMTEIAIGIAAGLISFGAATVVKGAAFALKMGQWAQKMQRLSTLLRSERLAMASRVAKHRATVRGLRALRMGTIEVGATVAVKGATDQELTAEELLVRFLFAAGLQAGSDFARFGLGPVGRHWGVTFRPPTRTAPPRSSVPPARPAPGAPPTRPIRSGAGSGANGTSPVATASGPIRVPLRDSHGRLRGHIEYPPGTMRPITGSPVGRAYPREGATLPLPSHVLPMVRRYAGASSRQRGVLSSRLGEEGGMEYLSEIAGRSLTRFRPRSDADVQRLLQMSAKGKPWDQVVEYQGRNVTDLVWHDGRVLHVVEAKGGNSPLGWRTNAAVDVYTRRRRSQGSPFLPLDVANVMMRSRMTDGRNLIGRAIEEADKANLLRYAAVRLGDRDALIAGNPTITVEYVLREAMEKAPGVASSPGKVVLTP